MGLAVGFGRCVVPQQHHQRTSSLLVIKKLKVRGEKEGKRFIYIYMYGNVQADGLKGNRELVTLTLIGSNFKTKRRQENVKFSASSCFSVSSHKKQLCRFSCRFCRPPPLCLIPRLLLIFSCCDVAFFSLCSFLAAYISVCSVYIFASSSLACAGDTTKCGWIGFLSFLSHTYLINCF